MLLQLIDERSAPIVMCDIFMEYDMLIIFLKFFCLIYKTSHNYFAVVSLYLTYEILFIIQFNNSYGLYAYKCLNHESSHTCDMYLQYNITCFN